MREHRWPVARQIALARDQFTCQDCRVEDWDGPLEVHHLVPLASHGLYDTPGCWHHVDGLVTLCTTCHQYRHLCLRAKPGAQLPLALAV